MPCLDLACWYHMELLLARHKKEQRDLVAQITSLKKQASKKTRRAVNGKCEQLQYDLDRRHEQERAEASGDTEETPEITPEQLLASLAINSDTQVVLDSVAEKDSLLDGGPGQKALDSINASAGSSLAGLEAPAAEPRRRNRAKERLAKRQAQIDAVKAEAAAEAENSVDYRAIEAKSMLALLRGQGLQLHEIQPDGHCLFRSVEDQLRTRHSDFDATVASLRTAAATHIRANPDDYIPYLFDQDTMQVRDVAEYTRELEETAMWGSDMEIAALAAVYDCPIKVLVAGSAPITFHEAGTQPELVVAYYKHSYGLGEHYNSCRDI